MCWNKGVANTDAARESQRLSETYSRMEDGELEELARQAASLTDVARRALKAEADRRKLPLKFQSENPNPAEQTQERPDLVIIRQFGNISEAFLARGCLESAGIESFLADANMAMMDWPVTRGMRLLVHASDAPAAIALLEESGSGPLSRR